MDRRERAEQTVKHLLKNADDPFSCTTHLKGHSKKVTSLTSDGWKHTLHLPQTTNSLVPQWPYL